MAYTLKNRHIIAILMIMAVFGDLYFVYHSQIPQLNEKELLKKNEFEIFLEKDPGWYRVNLPFEINPLRGEDIIIIM